MPYISLDDGFHMLLFENTTNMPSAVAATAWGHSLTCPTMNDKVFDALRTFRTAYINKGPETAPERAGVTRTRARSSPTDRPLGDPSAIRRSRRGRARGR